MTVSFYCNCASGGARFQRVQILNPPGSGKDWHRPLGVYGHVECYLKDSIENEKELTCNRQMFTLLQEMIYENNIAPAFFIPIIESQDKV